MFYYLISLILILIVRHTTEQYLLGTHFYINQDNILIDNTLKTVLTLARPYDLVAFIGQSERLARIDHLQTYIDSVDDVNELTSQQSDQINSDAQENNENIDKCNEFIDNGESSVFKILKTNLYDTFHVPFQLKNISVNYSFNEKTRTKLLTCNHFCNVNAGLATFDHLPSISSRYDDQQAIHIDDEELNHSSTENYDKQAIWSINELNTNRTSWLAYVYLSRYFHSNFSYSNAIDCLRCALIHGSNNDDIVLIELANIVFRYGYIRDAIVFIERALDYHLRLRPVNIKSIFIRSLLHYYLGNLCTIDNRFLLAIQFYNRTKILLDRIVKINDEQSIEFFSSSSLGSLSMPSLLSMSQKKIDALLCHLTLELSLQRKHHILQTKLAQLSQLRTITDELISLNALIKRDMSIGQSLIDYLRQLKEEKQLIICDWERTQKHKSFNNQISNNLFSYRLKYSTIMKQEYSCPVENNNLFLIKRISKPSTVKCDCRPREDFIIIDGDIDIHEESLYTKQQNSMLLRLAAIERTQSKFTLNDDNVLVDSIGVNDQMTLASTTSCPTLTSRLPTEITTEPKRKFILKQVNELYPPLNGNLPTEFSEQELPTYKDCQIHYYGLPSIGDYPTVWLPLENKGLLNVKQAFYRGLGLKTKHYPLPWSPPICTLNKPINEGLSIIENHSVLKRSSRLKAPMNRYDTNMLLNLYFYIDSIIDEQLAIEEFGQRLRSVGEKHEQLLPEWIVHLLSSLYWRVNGHLPHAIDCGLKAHETIISERDYKQWSDLTLVNLANILYLWGKYEDALDLTQQAYSVNSHEPITNYLLGNLLALTKHNYTAAQEYYRRALSIDPTHIYAHRQLRLSYCYAMYTAWETVTCSNDKDKCDKGSVPSESSSSSFDDRPLIDQWLNRTCLTSSYKRTDLLNEARHAYHSYGLCSSSTTNNNQIHDECSQGYAVTNIGNDIGHIVIIYDHRKHTFDYSLVFTNDYRNLFLKEGKLKCMIYGTGRKSSKCNNFKIMDPNIANPKHNMTWWRDPSTLYEHLKELIEIMNYENQLNNKTHADNHENNSDNLHEKYLSDSYILSKDVQEKYLLNNDIHFNENDCLNKSTVTYTPYLSTWISPQTKNIQFNYTFFKQIKKENIESNQPICLYPVNEQINATKNNKIIDYIIKKANENLTLYRAETILKPILLNLLFEKNPSITNKGGDDKALIGSFLAVGLNVTFYNSSWLYFHTLSLYWRLMGNASQALNCLFQSYILSPPNVQDLTYLSMALMLYNSQFNINEAIYLLYESLSVEPNGLLLAHFTLGNAMAKKGHLDFAELWYQSTLKLKPDFEPAKQRLRAIQC